MTTTINARERGGAPTHTPTHTHSSPNPSSKLPAVVFYDVITTPAIPLHIGQRVQLFALIPCNNRFPFDDEDSMTRYTAYDTGIEGTVVGIRAMDAAITEFVVRNESNRSTATYAHLAVEHIQGATVQVSLWAQIIRIVLLLLLTATRHIPLENKAKVYRSYAKPNGDKYPLRFLKHDVRAQERELRNEGGEDA